MYLRACERGARGRRLYWLSVALFGCALLSKSMAVSLPVVLLILEVYPLRRLGGSLGWASASARRVYLERSPFVRLAAAASAVARAAGVVAGVRGRSPAGARHRSERPADCGRSIYLSRRPRMGDPGRCRPVVLLAPLHELDDRGTGDVGACRYCHGGRYRVGSPHLEPGPGLA